MSNNHALPDGRPNDPSDVIVPVHAAFRAPTVGAPKGSGDFSRFLSALVRYKWLVVAAAVIGSASGFLASRFVRAEFMTQGTLWIESSDTRGGQNLGPILATQLLQDYAWVQLLKSFRVMDYVVEEEKLYVGASSPEYQWAFRDIRLLEYGRPGGYRLVVAADSSGWILTTPEGVEIERGRLGTPVGMKAGFQWNPPPSAWKPGRVWEFAISKPRDVAVQLSDNVQVEMIEGGRFMRLSLEGKEPRQIERTLNAVMDRFVAVATELKRAKLDELTRILDEQKQFVERNVSDATIELEKFTIETITMPSTPGSPLASGVEETRDPVMEHFFQMKINLDELRQDRLALGEILTQAQAGTFKLDALSAVAVVQSSPGLQQLLTDLITRRSELRALQATYTDEKTEVQAAAERVTTLELVQIPAAVRDLQRQLAARERDLEARIASASSEIKQIPPRLIQQMTLQRRVDIANQLYGNLRARYEEARLAAVSSVPDLRVIDKAQVPFVPIKNIRVMVFGGFFAGVIGLALLIILLLDRTDRRVRYPEQITGGMGLPILGAVPRVKGGMTAEQPYSAAQLSESFRELRLALVHAHGAAGPLLLSVTSAEAGDGKSTVAGCLAGVFASQGHRVLLLDGDIRRGNLHRSLGLQRAPGLTDYLAGRARLDEILQVSTERGFTLIGSGTRMQVGPELLGSPAMSHLIRTLRSQFAVVIVDTPPLGAGVDAYILGTATGNMIMVVRTGRTDSDLAEAKLSLLDRLPVRVLGAVFNDVPPSRIYRQYSYLSGYQSEDESMLALQVAAADTHGSEAAIG